MIVTAARQPAFYAGCGVEDTPEGRYEMIAVHLFLLVDRLRGQGADADRIAQRVLEAFVIDMDDNMREMGVGDLSVGPKVKRSAAGLYERFAAYRDALALGETEVAARLQSFVPGLTKSAAGQAELARYLLASRARLAALQLADILAAHLSFAGIGGREKP